MTRRLSQSLHTPNLCERSRLIEMRFRRLAMKQPTPRRCPNGASCGSTFRSRLCATTTSSSLRRVVRFIARAKPEIIWDHHSGRLLPLQVAIPYFLSMHYRGVLPPEWRFLPLFISLDIAHNVTTAFFLQTLKFHKFISATTFSFAFNTTAYIGSAMLLYYYLTQPVDPIAFFPAVAGCLMNLYFVYPKRGEPRLIQFIVALLALSPHTFRLAMDGDKFLPGVPGPSLAAGFVAVLAIVAWGLDPGLARRLTSWNTRFASSGSTLSHVLVLLGGAPLSARAIRFFLHPRRSLIVSTGGLFAFVLLNPLIKWQVKST